MKQSMSGVALSRWNLGLLVGLALAARVSAQQVQPAETVLVYTLDQANSSFVMMGDAFQQTFTCDGTPIDPAPVYLGPIHDCPSGNEIPVTLAGTLRLAVRRNPSTGVRQVRFAGGEILAGDVVGPNHEFSGTVGSCSSPDAQLILRNLLYTLESNYIALGGSAGCAPTDNLAGLLDMTALDGDSIISTALGPRTIPLDCKSSGPTPFCAKLRMNTFRMDIGAAAPLVFSFTHSVSQCSPFPVGRVDYTGNIRFSCSLRWQLLAILPGPAGDPTPNCP